MFKITFFSLYVAVFPSLFLWVFVMPFFFPFAIWEMYYKYVKVKN